MTTCADVVPFIDGELEPDHAAAFREHLVDCQYCQHNVLLGHQLSAQLSTQADRSDLEWLLEYVSAQFAALPACSCHDELRQRLASCSSMLVRMTR
jgi:anti-sigma factor RsiW